MACRNICHMYPIETRKFNERIYSGNNKRCSRCEVFIRYEGIRCPCCNMMLKYTVRDRKSIKTKRELKRI